MKSKTTATVLAFFLGWAGGHKFYLERTGLGFLYLFFFWTYIPALVSFVEFVILLVMSQAEFDRKFNPRLEFNAPIPLSAAVSNANQMAQNITINMVPAPGQAAHTDAISMSSQGNSPAAPSTLRRGARAAVPSMADELHKLNDLRIAGALTDEEFSQHKRRLLAS